LPDLNLNPIGPVHQCLALNLNLSGPRPKGSVQVQFRSKPEPQGKSQQKIYTGHGMVQKEFLDFVNTKDPNMKLIFVPTTTI
jgi:hypothetical protein